MMLAMRTKMHSKSVVNLTKEEYRECSRLTRRSDGLMSSELSYQRMLGRKSARAHMIRDADTGRLLAWALSFNNGSTNDRMTAYFYVRQEFRRRGFGTRLMKQVLKYEDNPFVARWNRTASCFFDAVAPKGYPLTKDVV